MPIPSRALIILGAILLCGGAQPASARSGVAAEAWEVSPSVVVEQQNLTFETKGAKLAGTLYFPRGARGQPALSRGISAAGRAQPSDQGAQ